MKKKTQVFAKKTQIFSPEIPVFRNFQINLLNKLRKKNSAQTPKKLRSNGQKLSFRNFFQFGNIRKSAQKKACFTVSATTIQSFTANEMITKS